MDEQVIDDDLWDEFHRVVNMSSRELSEWLRTDSAGERTETVPDQSGDELGRQVLAILGKRKVDLTRADVDTMATVVDDIRRLHPGDLEPMQADAATRRRLMCLGHDPLRPPPR